MDIEGFSIINNLRLVIIVVIFVSIVVAYLLGKTIRTRGRTGREKMKEGQRHGYGGKGSSGAIDDFLAIDETGDRPESGVSMSVDGTKVAMEAKAVVDREIIEAYIKNMRDEITLKIDADIRGIKSEIISKIERLIVKVKEGEKEVVNNVVTVVNTKAQELLGEIDDRIVKALQIQKNLTASTLEKMVSSLFTEEASAEIPPFGETKKLGEKEAGSGGIRETAMEVADDSKDIFEKEPAVTPQAQEFGEGVQGEGECRGSSEGEQELPSEADQYGRFIPEESEEIEMIEESKTDEKAPTETIASSMELEHRKLAAAKAGEVKGKRQEKEKIPGIHSDFDIQKFLNELESPPEGD